jgi:membrane associated rhomboid family serine protease
MFQMQGFQNIPPVVRNLLLANIVFFLAQNVLPWFDNTFALHYIESPLFKPWQVITHMFMHGGIGHLFFNMFSLYMFGSILEQVWGSKRFLNFYLLCGLGAVFLHMAVLAYQYHQILGLANVVDVERLKLDIKDSSVFNNKYPAEILKIAGFLIQKTVGASGAIYGLLAGYAYLFPNTILNIYFAIPVKAKYAIAGMIVLEFILGTANIAGDNTAHFAHLGGAILGLLLVYYWNKTNKKTFY